MTAWILGTFWGGLAIGFAAGIAAYQFLKHKAADAYQSLKHKIFG